MDTVISHTPQAHLCGVPPNSHCIASSSSHTRFPSPFPSTSPSQSQSPLTSSLTLASSSRPKRFTPRFPVPPSQNYLASACTNLAGRKRTISDVETAASSSAVTSARNVGCSSFSDLTGRDIDMEGGCNIGATHDISNVLSPRRKSQRLLCGEESSLVDYEDDHISGDVNLRELLRNGWKRLPASLSIAVRGWVRYIERHYHLDSADILLHSEAYNVYLVRTRSSSNHWTRDSNVNTDDVDAATPCERYYLFADNLSQAVLMGSTTSEVMANLNPLAISRLTTCRADGQRCGITPLVVAGGNNDTCDVEM